MGSTKTYTVWYVIKANRAEWLHKINVEATNSRDAVRICKEKVRAKTGKNAFRPSTSVNSFFWYSITPEKRAAILEEVEKTGYSRL